MDETRPLARIELRDAAARLLGADDGTDVCGALADTGAAPPPSWRPRRSVRRRARWSGPWRT
ncbi:hypothetical protein SMICM17S_09056 [Streptomyces microflavus]